MIGTICATPNHWSDRRMLMRVMIAPPISPPAIVALDPSAWPRTFTLKELARRAGQAAPASAADGGFLAWRARVAAAFATVRATGPRVDEIVAGSTYLTADVTRPEDLRRLLDACVGTPAIYFALPPAVTR